MQRAGAGVEGDAVARAAVAGELPLELRDLVAEDELGARADSIQGGEDFLSDLPKLPREVEVGDSLGQCLSPSRR